MYDPERIFYQLQKKRFEAFKAQNPEDDDFDVVFEIDGKKLFAHKFMLCPISTTFKSMLSDRWTNPGKAVKVEGYTFEDFKEFITSIYSGKCQLTNANIVSMTDISEFYGIQELKYVCEDFLTETGFNRENVHQMFELACKYSLKDLKTYLYEFIANKFKNFLNSEKSQSLQKTTVKELVEENKETWNQEEMFQGIFKWAKNRACEIQKLNPDLNINEAIKEEISEILPLIKFERMDSVFFNEFVAKKSFLFSGDKWNDILKDRKTKLYVKVIDGNGKILKGEIQCDDTITVANAIINVKDQCCRKFNSDYFDWPKVKHVIPSTPSKLIHTDNIQWYLVFDHCNELAIKREYEFRENDYLLAEMSEEDEFQMSDKCKIETFSFCV